MNEVIIISPDGSTAERLYSMRDIGMIKKILTMQNYKVKVIDCVEYSNSIDEIKRIILNDNPLVIIGIFMWPQLLDHKLFIKLFEEIHKIHENSTFIALGRIATIGYERLLNNYKVIDIVITGESEKTIPELLSLIKNKKDFKQQKGIAYLKDKSIILNDKQDPIQDLDTLPFPDRSYLKNKKLYPIAPMYTSRYCYAKCKFCLNRYYYSFHSSYEYRARSADLVIQEIEEIIINYKVNIFYFVDDNFFVDGDKGKVRAVEIAEKLIKKDIKISYYIECRVNDIEKELFSLLRKSGLRKVYIGVESGCQSFLDRYKKDTTVKQNEEAINILRDLSINFEPGFIMFEPYSNIEDLKQNLSFIKKNKLNLINYPITNTLLKAMNFYDTNLLNNNIDYQSVPNNNSNYTIPYIIRDQKVQLIFNLITIMNRTINDIIKQYKSYQNKINTLFMTNNNNVISDIDYKKNKEFLINIKHQISKWIDQQISLSMDILEKIIEYFSENEFNNADINKINHMINDQISKFHLKHFNCSYKDNIENIKKKLKVFQEKL